MEFQVVVRVRPVNDHERGGVAVVEASSNSLSVGERKFTFDSVLESNSSQANVFQLVGIPLVRSALAGYNTSILSYGQTGSGKTYTMWGPPSAMVEDPSPNSQQGIVPRIFSEIQRLQENSEGKQINYQCRCSFLEIYNDQIGDLLDPMQRNLEIRDDPKNGLHVVNLSEEYVSSYEDVTQILIKTFAVLSGVHSLVVCILKRLRGKDDVINAGVAGCCTGLAISFPGAPQSLLQNCLAFGAFSFIVDGLNEQQPALAHSFSPRKKRHYCIKSHFDNHNVPLSLVLPLSVLLPNELKMAFSFFCKS